MTTTHRSMSMSMSIVNLYSAISWSISIALNTLVSREKSSLQITPKATTAVRWITEIGTICVINLFSMELTYMWGTKQCWNVPKITKLVWRYRQSNVVASFFGPRCMCHSQSTHTHNCFMALWILSRQPGWAGTRRNIHPLTLIMVVNHPYLLSPSTTIHGILPIQSTCFTVFLRVPEKKHSPTLVKWIYI